MNLAPLPVDFYHREPIAVARELLGKRLIRRSRAGLTSGMIVEVEAYLAEADAACHANRGRTRRNATMFGPPGRLYVYPIHARYCMNAVTQSAGTASAVLIRAIEPHEGIELMQTRRGRDKPLELARGPARLCQALDVDRRLDGWDLTLGRKIWIAADATNDASALPIGRSTRIGVTSAHDKLLRFFIRGNEFVSGPKKLAAAAK